MWFNSYLPRSRLNKQLRFASTLFLLFFFFLNIFLLTTTDWMWSQTSYALRIDLQWAVIKFEILCTRVAIGYTEKPKALCGNGSVKGCQHVHNIKFVRFNMEFDIGWIYVRWIMQFYFVLTVLVHRYDIPTMAYKTNRIVYVYVC